jgi:hypothetical protein
VDEKPARTISDRLSETVFPQIPRWFDDVASPLVGALLERWPTLQNLQRAHPGTLRRFFREQNCRRAKKIEQRIADIYQALPATPDRQYWKPKARRSRVGGAVEDLRDNIAELDRRIAQVTASHPEAALFNPCRARERRWSPAVVAFGTRRERFDSAYLCSAIVALPR